MLRESHWKRPTVCEGARLRDFFPEKSQKAFTRCPGHRHNMGVYFLEGATFGGFREIKVKPYLRRKFRQGRHRLSSPRW